MKKAIGLFATTLFLCLSLTAVAKAATLSKFFTVNSAFTDIPKPESGELDPSFGELTSVDFNYSVIATDNERATSAPTVCGALIGCIPFEATATATVTLETFIEPEFGARILLDSSSDTATVTCTSSANIVGNQCNATAVAQTGNNGVISFDDEDLLRDFLLGNVNLFAISNGTVMGNGTARYNFAEVAAEIPLPASVLLLLTGFGGLFVFKHRNKKTA